MEKRSSNYEYNKRYAEAYLKDRDEIKLRMPKGEKPKIQAHAESMGESANAFINRAIRETMERDKEKGLE